MFVDSAPEWVPPLDKVVDFAQLDVLLVSNYTCMLALPFVLDAPGFRGQVLATEPTLQIGRCVLARSRDPMLPKEGYAGCKL